jgi:hypothetical protein
VTDPVLNAVAELFPLPTAAIPLAVTVVLSYIDEDGEDVVALACGGESSFTDRLGCLTWAQHQMLTAQPEADDFPEED